MNDIKYLPSGGVRVENPNIIDGFVELSPDDVAQILACYNMWCIKQDIKTIIEHNLELLNSMNVNTLSQKDFSDMAEKIEELETQELMENNHYWDIVKSVVENYFSN